MQPQYLAAQNSCPVAFAAFPSHGGGMPRMTYVDFSDSAILRARASRGACISYERQGAGTMPRMSEQKDRSKECQRPLKPSAHLASSPQCQLAVAVPHRMTNTWSSIRPRSLLSRPTQANTSNTPWGRALRPASTSCAASLRGVAPSTQEATQC